MKKTAIFPAPHYYDRYIDLVPDVTLQEAFQYAKEELDKFNPARHELRGDFAYAPGKWTLKDVILHITDTERVHLYRAMSFARKERGPLAGFDQDKYAAGGLTQTRTLESLMQELKVLRAATENMYATFSDPVLLRVGVCWKYEMSVLAMGFTIIGHQLHHFKVIKEKYL
ncbi:DinB family protein [Chitinophaga sp. Hz27]|uniref:DinB family protein n=1 Tax=Chitinophaga sp. Hz27 TaxID=3347169 RepID=UPI0035DAE416